ncbi:MAG: DUF2283 domain-containing protein [Candidatus Marinimicrobia bacterium]|nr:DUF2283 domain-containing protein [Candidatus Neomarinimicrobiota bacterium]MCH8011759.1 DUF2283 domain-containing protein [Candidatus Neomarinimicrobiota bacterium]
MKINYDREEDILMIETSSEGTIDHAEHTEPFIAHFSKEGQLLLLEILDASEFLTSVLKTSLSGKEQELPLSV